MTFLRSSCRLALFAALSAGFSLSCQSMSEGVLTVEGRALVLDDAEIDAIQNGSFNTDTDVDLKGYGAHVALMTPIVDILGGVDWREYGDADTPEIVLGVRRRIFELWRLHPYIEGNLRYGTDLEFSSATAASTISEDYTSWAAGVGAIVDLSSSWFVNVRLMYENTPIETPAGEVDVDGLVGTLGLGISF